MTGPVTRRLVLGSFATAAFGAAGIPPNPFPDMATLLVGGPGGSTPDDWADWLTPGLGRALPPGTVLRKTVVGGADGVTAANQFEARAEPDGSTALLLPGAAALACLTGDPRARFDAGLFVSALAGVTPGLVVSRRSLATVPAAAPLRIGAGHPAGGDLPAMLALDLLGIPWMPVFGLDHAQAIHLLADAQVDAVCLRGHNVPALLAEAAAAGAVPVFSFGSVDDTGARRRDPAFPDLPCFDEFLAARPAGDEALRRAWFATAAASGLDIALVLPHLTPAALVAQWRHAAAQAAATVQAQASAAGVRALASPAANGATAALVTDTAAQLALRQWMARRLDWRPA